MVTKGYQKGVYDRLPWTLGASLLGPTGITWGQPPSVQRAYLAASMINRARPGGKCRCEQFGYARTVAANRSKDNKSNRGFGSLRRIFQTMMLIDLILRQHANESDVKVLTA